MHCKSQSAAQRAMHVAATNRSPERLHFRLPHVVCSKIYRSKFLQLRSASASRAADQTLAWELVSALVGAPPAGVRLNSFKATRLAKTLPIRASIIFSKRRLTGDNCVDWQVRQYRR